MQIDELAGALYRWADAAWEFVQASINQVLALRRKQTGSVPGQPVRGCEHGIASSRFYRWIGGQLAA
jgi:hypothetical protein